ncbi:MAG: ABC transporter permease [Acidobacteriia bacterium]|nr:ABC transporter permease [Terriglobia bacterium]
MRFIEDIAQDVRYGLRMLARSPGVTAAVVLTLALGIGATTAIFTVVNGVLLRPLPYPEPERLVYIRGNTYGPFATRAEYLAWKDRSQTLSHIAAYMGFQGNLTVGDEAERVTCGTVTPSFMPLLGVQPVVGRNFSPDDDGSGTPAVVLLSHALWKRRFSSDPSVVGRTLTLDAKSYTIIGVLPASFQIPDQYSFSYGLWTPLSLSVAGEASVLLVRVIARLKPGVSHEQSLAELDTIMQSTLRRGTKRHAVVTEWHEEITHGVKRSLLIFLAAVGFVLLIACVNIANLLLSRASARNKEVTIRLALGAGKARIIRQLLTESLLMALFGGTLGLVLATWGKDVLVAFISANLPTLDPIRLDHRVLGFNLVLTLLTGLASGLAPALHASRIPLNESLKEAGRSSTEARSGRLFRSLLVVGEIALTMVLLIGAGLLLRSFLHLRGIDPGFKSERILTMNIDLTLSKYPKPLDQASFFQQVMERIKGLRGVKSVGASSSVPLLGYSGSRSNLSIEGRNESIANLSYSVVSSDYFRTMSIPLKQGRYFTDSDREGSPSVLIVNESFARHFFPDGDCLGRRVESWIGKNNWMTIVGVVSDVRDGLESEASPGMYCSYLQASEPHMTVLVRTVGDPMDLAAAVRSQIAGIDKSQPSYDLMDLEERRTKSLGPRRVNMLLFGSFAALALVLGAVGIFGVVSYSVSQRTHEIGVRMALGAGGIDVVSLVLGRVLLLVIVGEAVGLAGALALNKVIASMVFRVATTDPLTYAGVSFLWIMVALLACCLPARRATKVDPMVALRSE